MRSPSSSTGGCRLERRCPSSATASCSKSTHALPTRSTTSSRAASPRGRRGGKGSSVRERVEEVLRGEEAWVVGGAIRDELLRRPLVDLDVACLEPEAAARAYARGGEGAPFPLSDRWGA